jgi:hypothetical protein
MNYIKRRRALEALQNRMREAFYKSQDICPVISGKLKRSGFFSLTEKGARIVYSAEYADNVEKGKVGGVERIQGYWRNGFYVNSYTRQSPPITPNPFVSEPVKDGIQQFLQDLKKIV